MIYLNGKTELAYNADFIHFEVDAPSPKIEQIEVPLRDGYINASEMLSDHVFYSSRTVTIGLELRGLRGEWPLVYSQILRDLHGQTVKVARTEDPGWYWTGSASVGALDDHGATAGVTITVNAQPFKRTEQWYEVYNGTISGDVSVSFVAPFMRCYPEFDVSSAGTTVTYNGETWTLPVGKSTCYGLSLVGGDVTLALHGSGAVKVTYRGGAL